jgi:serine/threonine protein kinase
MNKSNDINDIKVIEEIFKGPFSEVYKVSIGNNIYVKKIVKNKSLFLREIEILKKISSIHSPIIHNFYKDINSYIIILEYIDGLDLKNYINKNKLTKEQIFFIIKQIIKGFINIHNNHVYHRDIKPENIMITKDGIVKIIDYGLSCIIGKNCDKLIKGTPFYVAPELFFKSGFIEEKDWYTNELYSIGCVLYFILHGYSPYENKNINSLKELKEIVKSNKDTPYDNTEYHDIDFILNKLLLKNPSQRISLEEALKLIEEIS